MRRLKRLSSLLLVLAIACGQAEARPKWRRVGGHGRGGGSVAQTVVATFGLSTLARDALEGTTNYNSFPGACRANDGTWIMPFRDSTNHGVQFNTSTIDVIRSFDLGFSWQDQTEETTVVAASANYDPYSPSCTRLANNNIILKYEKVWTSPYPAGDTTTTDEVVITANVARARVPSSTNWQIGMVISTTGHTTNATHVAISAIPDSTHIEYPLVGSGTLADGTGVIQIDIERSVHVRISTDNGATFGSEINVANPGVLTPFRRYTSAGGPIIQLGNGDLFSPDYHRQYNQLRYTSHGAVSTDNGANWSYRAIMAQDANTGNSTAPGSWGFQFEEPNCILIDADSIGCLIRVDDAAGTLGDNALDATIFWVRSDDSGNTWSAPVASFPGNGWPTLIRTTNGVCAATTRDNLDQGGFVNRPTLWLNRSCQATGWTGPTFYGNNSFASPRYMYSGGFEHPNKTNHLVLFVGQEVTLNNANTLFSVEIALDTSIVLPSYRSTRSALWGNANNTYVTYDSDTFLNGATSALFVIKGRYDSDQGGTQNLFSRGTADAQERFRMVTGNDLEIGFATAATTYATETYNDVVFPLDRNTCVFILYDGGNGTAANRARIWYASGQGTVTEDTTPDVTSGTMPATLRTSATNFWLGASGAATGSNPRQFFFGELVIWANPNVTTAANNASAICNRSVSFDYSTSALGAPSVWIRLDGNFADSQNVLDNPVLTGSDITHVSTWPFGPGYLSP